MSPEQYQRVKSILQEAMELEPALQLEFVEQACAGDAGLAGEVRSLLEHDAQTSGFLERPAWEGEARKAGRRIGQYELIEPIGAGGMGEVYRARDARLGREVAIKFLPAALAHDPDSVSRFDREVRAAGSLNHPNILTVHDCGRQGAAQYLVSELLHGETLRERLKGSPVKPSQAVAWAAQAARGLSAAHARSIVHRDLKPDNLFVTRDGTVKILDFGLAKLPGLPPAGSGVSQIPTQAGLILGTFGYMAPEQVRALPAGPQSDIFSLGVILYELLAGRRPFERATWTEETDAVLTAEPPDLPPVVSGISDPAKLHRIVARCLSKEPEDRFESARDLAFALESLLEPGAVKAPSHRVRWAIFGTAAAVVLAVAVLLAVRGHQAPAGPAFQRLTFRRGIVSAARFTADGSTIVYSAAWDLDDFRLYSTRSDNPESHMLGHSGAMLLAVSSQSELALCLPTDRTQHGVVGKLVRVPLSGGGPLDRAGNVAAADWSPDGSELAVIRMERQRWQIEYPIGRVLRRSDLPGGYMEAIRVSPRNDAVAFLDHPLLDDSAGSVAMVDRDGNYRALSSRFNSMRGLSWSPDGKEVWFAAARRGTTLALWAVDRAGRERVIARVPAYVSLEDISHDGRALVSLHHLSESMVYVPPGGPSRDLYWHDESQVQDISRDGKFLLFAESGDTTRQDYEVYGRPVDGSAAVHLGTGLPLSLSFDGRWVIANPAGSPAQLTLLPTGIGETRSLTNDKISHVAAAFLPDGKSFVFAGTAPGENLRYYRQSLEGGEPRPITGSDIRYERRSPIVVSPDGQSVATVGEDQRILIYPTGGGDPRAAPGLEPGFVPLQWCPDQRLVVHRYGQQPPQLWKAGFHGEKAVLWKELNPPDPVGLLDITPIRVSPDCQSYAYSPLNVLSQVYLTTGLR